MYVFPVMLLLAFAALLILSIFLDRRKQRAPAAARAVSVIIPCFNDAACIADTVASVFASWPAELLDVQVVDDCSTDNSRGILQDLSDRYPIRLILNETNIGKSRGINQTAATALHETLLFLDSDTELNPEALRELLSRLQHSDRIGAVSCACTPKNRGFLPSMQLIEYNMHRLGMGASNLTSVPGLWGGCMLTRRDLFLSMGGFKRSALTEDTEYAFRLIRAGYRVEQAFSHVKTEVPDRLPVWIRQKLRWAGGAFQCGLLHPGVLLKNPVLIAGICLYSFLAVRGVVGLFDDVSGVEIVKEMSERHQEGADLPEVVGWLRSTQSGLRFLVNVTIVLLSTLLSTLYVFPSVNSGKDLLKLFWLIPYLLGYIPVYMLVTLAGSLFWILFLRNPARRKRAW